MAGAFGNPRHAGVSKGGLGMSKTIHAVAVYPGEAGSVHRTEIPAPEPGDDEVLVDVIRVGVCGTDREIISGVIGKAPEGADELVIGHEVFGRVAAVGKNVTKVKVGDFTGATVRRPDGCPACAAGQPDMCVWHQYTERGIQGANGFMAEQFVEHEQYIVSIPTELASIGVLTEPLTVVEKAVRQVRLIQRRMPWWQPKTAVVLGAGPIGLLGALLLRSQGVEEVVAVARTPAPNSSATILEAAGARYVSTEEMSIPEVGQHYPQIDVILESTGVSAVAFDGIPILGNDGVMVLLSLTGGTRTAEIPTDAINTGIVGGNKTIVGSVNAGFEDFTNAVASLRKFESLWPGLAGTLITSRLPVTGDVSQIASKARDEIKMVVEFGP
jgi:threonine dehydrogenase-like Zn-dependent dehydrogenase